MKRDGGQGGGRRGREQLPSLCGSEIPSLKALTAIKLYLTFNFIRGESPGSQHRDNHVQRMMGTDEVEDWRLMQI